MTNKNEHPHHVSREVILESLQDIREMHDHTCIDRVADVRLRANGEVELVDVHPDDYRDGIPEGIYRGRVIRLDFGVGIMPRAVTDWLTERVDDLHSIAAGLHVHDDQHCHEVDELSAAQEALERLQAELNDINDPILSQHRITRYVPKDFFASPEQEICQLKSAEAARQWAMDAVNNRDPLSDANAARVILDVEESVSHVLRLWREANQPPMMVTINGSDW